jgi:hypothetical protein
MIKLMTNKNTIKYKIGILVCALSIIELTLFIILSSFFSTPVVSSGNTTVVVNTSLTIGIVFPEVLSVNISDGRGSNITLNPDATDIVNCSGLVRDYNNRSYIGNVTAVFFWRNSSNYSDIDDNNTHYSNNSCVIDYNVTNIGYGDDPNTENITANYTCSFPVQYYANSGSWNCTVYAYSIYNDNGTNSTTTSISQLLALSLPSTINYGTVNATAVSEENITNVSNVGNVPVNLSLNGYAVNSGDNLAMNCTKGSTKNISIVFEKYNLTASTPVVTSLTDFESKYVNLTSTATVKRFSLYFRQNDSVNEAINATYWRIYVPKGVAGSCEGKIVFAASTATGS